MPVEFPPSWEYYTPAPEVAALFDRSGVCPAVARLGFGRDDAGERAAAPGVQFTDRPDGYRSRLAPPKPERARPEPTREICRRCGWVFLCRPDRPRRYCARFCYDEAKAAAKLLRPVSPPPPKPESVKLACPTCAQSFRPRDKGQRFCSRSCFQATRKKPPKTRREPGPSAATLEAFAVSWTAGESVAALAARFRVNRATLTNWRRRLGLPARPRGGAHAAAGRWRSKI